MVSLLNKGFQDDFFYKFLKCFIAIMFKMATKWLQSKYGKIKGLQTFFWHCSHVAMDYTHTIIYYYNLHIYINKYIYFFLEVCVGGSMATSIKIYIEI